jgi:hypothetical protein
MNTLPYKCTCTDDSVLGQKSHFWAFRADQYPQQVNNILGKKNRDERREEIKNTIKDFFWDKLSIESLPKGISEFALAVSMLLHTKKMRQNGNIILPSLAQDGTYIRVDAFYVSLFLMAMFYDLDSRDNILSRNTPNIREFLSKQQIIQQYGNEPCIKYAINNKHIRQQESARQIDNDCIQSISEYINKKCLGSPDNMDTKMMKLRHLYILHLLAISTYRLLYIFSYFSRNNNNFVYLFDDIHFNQPHYCKGKETDTVDCKVFRNTHKIYTLYEAAYIQLINELPNEQSIA